MSQVEQQLPTAAADRPRQRPAIVWALIVLAVGLLIPSTIVFALEVADGHVGPLVALANTLGKQFGRGHNLFLLAVYGLIPFVALASVCLFASSLPPARIACLALGGLVPLAWYTISAHLAVWRPPLGPGQVSSTAAIGFLFVPWFAFGPLAVGLLVGWVVSPGFRPGIPRAAGAFRWPRCSW